MAAVKSPPITELDLIAPVIESYPKLDRGSPSSWAVFNDDLTLHNSHISQICHAGLNLELPGIYDTLITAAPFHKKALDYYRWLCSGPFRAYSDLISLERHEASGELFFRCSNLDKWPSNVLKDFCIATRVPIESMCVIPRWECFVSVGMDKSLAFMVAHRVGINPWAEGRWGFKEPDLSGDPWVFVPKLSTNLWEHMWLNVTSDWSRVIRGEMDLDKVVKVSYKADPTKCDRCNIIWGLTAHADHMALQNKNMEELHKHFNLPVNKIDPNAKPAKKPRKSKATIVLEELMHDEFEPEVAMPAIDPNPHLVPVHNGWGDHVPMLGAIPLGVNGQNLVFQQWHDQPNVIGAEQPEVEGAEEDFWAHPADEDEEV